MTKQIEAAMEEDLKNSAVDGPRRPGSSATAKLHAIVNKIGYPDKWRDYSSHRDPTATTSSATSQRATASSDNRQLAKIGKPVDRSEWDMTPPTVNAYYNP